MARPILHMIMNNWKRRGKVPTLKWAILGFIWILCGSHVILHCWVMFFLKWNNLSHWITMSVGDCTFPKKTKENMGTLYHGTARLLYNLCHLLVLCMFQKNLSLLVFFGCFIHSLLHNGNITRLQLPMLLFYVSLFLYTDETALNHHHV